MGFVYQSSRTEDITLVHFFILYGILILLVLSIYNLQDYHLSRVLGSGLYLPVCPKPGLSALYTAIYGLLFSLLAISILLIYIIRWVWQRHCNLYKFTPCSARFSSRLSSRNSFNGIWLLSIITYKYTADTCFNLLRCQKVSGNENSGEFVRQSLIIYIVAQLSISSTILSLQVYYYDGTVKCFQSTHIYISVVAVLLSISVVIPFPLLILVISYRRFKVWVIII